MRDNDSGTRTPQPGQVCFVLALLFCMPTFPALGAPKLDIEYYIADEERSISLVLNLDSEIGENALLYHGHRVEARPDNEPCLPAVPRYSLYLAIPWDATPVLAEVETVPGKSVSTELPLNTVPSVKVDQTNVVRIEEVPCQVSSVPSSYPEVPARIRTVGVLRDYKLVLLDLFVGTYNQDQGLLQRYNTLTIRITLGHGSFEPGKSQEADETRSFRPLYESTIANLTDARQLGFAHRSTPYPSSSDIEQLRAPLSTDTTSRIRVEVDQDGLFVVDYDRLADTGVLVDELDPATLGMETQGHKISIIVEGEGDGGFDPGDRILFYGQAPDEPYEKVSVYYISVGGPAGKRMLERDICPTGTEEQLESYQAFDVSEENYFYFPNPPVHDMSDHWFFEVFYPGDSYDFPLDAHDCVKKGGVVSLKAALFGASDLAWIDPDHHLQFKLGDELVEDVWWDGQQFVEVSAQFPTEWLFDDTKLRQLRILEPGDTGADLDMIYLNRLELSYPARFLALQDFLDAHVEFPDERGGFFVSEFSDPAVVALDVTDPLAPVMLTGIAVEDQVDSYSVQLGDVGGEHHYILASGQGIRTPSVLQQIHPVDLRSSALGADLLIVTHRDFSDSIQPLVLQREAEGLRVAVVDVADVFEGFSHGIPTPWAIRDFIKYVMTHWKQPAPSYLLLVGDATLDTMGYLSDLPDNENFLPTFHMENELMGQVATDQWFTTVLGDDQLPDLFVGRIPADSVDEVDAYVDKVLSYEVFGNTANWTRRALIIVDDGFIPEASNVSSEFSGYLCSNNVFLDDYLRLSWQVDDVIKAISDGFNAGVALAVFFGHGGHSNWTHEGIWEYEDLKLLDHEPAYPFLAALTCLNGYFDNPWSDVVLAEGFLAQPKGGAIGMMAPTREVAPSHLEALGHGLVKAVYQDEVQAMGPATEAARLSLLADFSMAGTVAAMVTLFGDPSLRLRLPTKEDVDGSGRIDGGDLIMVSRYFDSAVASECSDQWNTDIDSDGLVTDSDVQILRKTFGEVSN